MTTETYADGSTVTVAATPGFSVMHGPICNCPSLPLTTVWTPCIPSFDSIPDGKRPFWVCRCKRGGHLQGSPRCKKSRLVEPDDAEVV